MNMETYHHDVTLNFMHVLFLLSLLYSPYSGTVLLSYREANTFSFVSDDEKKRRNQG